MTTIREIIGSWAIPQNFKNQLEYYMSDPDRGGWELDEAPDADFYNLTDAHLKELGITAVRFRIRIMRYVRGRALAIQQQQQKSAEPPVQRSLPSAPPQESSQYSSARSISPPPRRVPRDDLDQRQSRSLPDKTDRTVVNNITLQTPSESQSSQQNRGYQQGPPPPNYGPGYRPSYGYGGGYGGGYGYGRPPIVEVIEPVPVGYGFGGGGLLGAEILGAEIGLGAGLLAEEALLL